MTTNPLKTPPPRPKAPKRPPAKKVAKKKTQSKALAKRPAAEPEARLVHQPTPMELIHHAMANNVSPEQLTTLVDLKERLDRQAAASHHADMVAQFQRDCPPVTRSRSYDMGRGGSGVAYASLDDIMAVARPIMGDCGLSVGFSIVKVGEKGTELEVTCHVRCGIHQEDYTIPVAVPVEMSVNQSQKMGAAHSYARRYAILAALNIVITDEDNDARTLEEAGTSFEDAVRLLEMLEALPKETQGGFWEWLDLPDNQLELLPASRYQEVHNNLRGKLAQLERGARG